MNNDVAIVIPAVKPDFLTKALNSLAAQTNKNFCVYIHDDAGPENIRKIAESYTSSLTIKYHRFEHNLGKTDLVAQWQRCVELQKHETWFCLFSDDDIMAPECIQEFYNTLNITKSAFDVYRFDIAVIDGNDNLLTICPKAPHHESAIKMAYQLLLGNRGNSMSEHFFKRDEFLKKGGFVNFPLGQASDWVTSILHGIDKGIYTIPGPLIYWRRSKINISTTAYKNKAKSFVGHLSFIQWLFAFFSEKELLTNGITKDDFSKALKQNLINITRDHYRGFPLSLLLKTARVMHKLFSISIAKAITIILKLNLSIKIKKTYIATRKSLHLKDYSAA